MAAQQWIRGRADAELVPLVETSSRARGHVSACYDVSGLAPVDACLRHRRVDVAGMYAMLADILQAMSLLASARPLPVDALFGRRHVFADASWHLHLIAVPWDLSMWAGRHTPALLLARICRHAHADGPDAQALLERIRSFADSQGAVLSCGGLQAFLKGERYYDTDPSRAPVHGAAVLRNLSDGTTISLGMSCVCVMGRDERCDVVLAGAHRVSRRHASILCGQDGVAITDEGSTNGTFVRGKRLVPHRCEHIDYGQSFSLANVAFCVDAG